VRRRQRNRIRGVIVHDTQVVGPLHGDEVLGIPAMSPARTLCDLIAVVRPWVAERAVDDELRRKLTTVAQLRAVLGDLDGRGRRRGTVMHDILGWREGGLPGDSAAEVRVVKLLAKAWLPQPVQQFVVPVGARRLRIDLAYPESRIAIEYDGWDYHSTRDAFDRDRARANDLELAGWKILRFTSRATDEVIVGTVRTALSRARVTSTRPAVHT
jgi:hypothetical protein